MTCKPKIFIGFHNISGIPHDLCLGFRELGYECNFLSLEENYLQYTSGDQRWFFRWWRKVKFRTGHASGHSKPVRTFWSFCHNVASVGFFIFSLLKYQVFMFCFNKSFSRKFWDIPLLKLCGKKIIFIYFGSDSRPIYLDGTVQVNPENLSRLLKEIQQQKENIVKAEKYADYVIDHQPTSHFHEKPVVAWLQIGLARKVPPGEAQGNNGSGPVKILHSPSHPASKGTAEIRLAVEALQNKGHKIEFIEIIGQPNKVVLKCLAECDFVIDQLYSDTPMASFATEAAFLGKPAIVGGYYADGIKRDLPADVIPPSVYVRPENLEAAIENLLLEREYRLELGQKAKLYAEKHCRPEVVAGRLLRLINDDVPDDWFFTPRDIRYLHGYGRRDFDSKAILAAVIQAGGWEALQLADKPELEEMLVEFAGQTP